jgi:hypothetical protein
MLPNCKVGFKRGRKYFKGELVDGVITKPKQVRSLNTIPKFDKYVTIRFYNTKAKAKLNMDELFAALQIDGALYLMVDEIAVAPKVKKPRRGKPDKEPEQKVYKVEKPVKVDKAALAIPLSEDISPKAWSKEFFKIKNHLCLGCTKKCKQSARVTVVYCPKYTKKG